MEENKVVKSRFKRVCVFCGSSTGKRDCYGEAALELAKELVAIQKPFCQLFFQLQPPNLSVQIYIC